MGQRMMGGGLVVWIGAFVLLPVWGAQAVPIQGLFNTGLDSSGTLLTAGGMDAHYSLVSSADPTYAGPGVYYVESDGMPIGPWTAQGPNSGWVSPRWNDDCSIAAGDYVYRTTFDLNGMNLTKVALNGRWSADDSGYVRLNGVNIGQAAGGFTGWNDLSITNGFVPGVNILEFVVNNGGAWSNPSGVRVEIGGTGEYLAYNTGVDDSMALLADGAVDSHFTLINSADGSYPGPDAYVAVADGFPIGPWISQGPSSKWIAPRADGDNVAADGTYTYRTTIDLTGLNPATASVSGQYAVDNSLVDILINGVSTGQSGGGFGGFNPFTITQGFVSGVNTVDFVVRNGPDGSPNPTGFRAEMVANAAIPEPATIALVGMGLVGLVRRRSAR